MMVFVVTAVCAIALLACIAGMSVYLYGRFAHRCIGRSSKVLPVKENETALDRFVSPLLLQDRRKCGILLFSDARHAFLIRALSARTAERSLDLQYYSWKDDFTGTLLAGEILAAADRGVRVRLLLDDINLHGKDAKYLSLDAHPNIEVRVFNPCWNRTGVLRRGFELLCRAYSATRRMHNKAWIADGRVAIIGGRNIGDPYFDASEVSNFQDLDLAMVGGPVKGAEDSFDSFWNSDCVLPLASLPAFEHGNITLLRERCDAAATGDNSIFFFQAGDADATIGTLLTENKFHWVGHAKVVSDPPEKWLGAEKHRWLRTSLAPLLTSARAKLELTSPYFVPGEQGCQQLLDMVQRGVAVTVLTNSLAATDVAMVHGGYARYRQRLIRGGVVIYELKPRPQQRRLSLFGSTGASLHTKAFNIDDSIGFVGSLNLDARSVSLNTEMGVIFHHSELAKELGAVFRRQIGPKSSYRVEERDGQLVWTNSDDPHPQTREKEPGASIYRRFIAKLIGYLPIESQL